MRPTMRPARTVLAMCAAVGIVGCHSGPQESAAASAPPLTRLRIAMEQPGTDCAADSPAWPTQEREYVRHLSARMEIPVEVCPVPGKAEAARALAENRVDLALLDPASIAPWRDRVRPILTQRTPTELGRTEVVLAAADASPLRTLPDADRAALAFAGNSPARLDGPRRTMASAGIPQPVLAGARILASPAEAVAAMRADPKVAVAFLSADWSRLCRGAGKDDHPCTGLRELWRGRAQAAAAWSVRQDIPAESWARLVGIHVALFEDKPEVARWLAPDTTEIEPTEAGALDPARAPR